ncbi:DNA polymerase II [Acidianus sp. HS-5]|uniref:DNA polymerase II n=1 Tax=Acidianus sp. HS-5 TaxID=2886040 RepID=UPI001F309D97|nr:DNA polymerase II [Acidianus sp. HS-5]BDC18542.1 hypothetical protein HS5_14320 [Acidianus sp. HS-5]
MGRTQPSYTKAVNEEISKIEKVLERTHSSELLDYLEKAKERVRYFQNASYDEDLDPRDIVLLSILSSIAEECKNGRLRS